MTDCVRYAVRGDVAVITLDNPPVNALGHELRSGLVGLVQQAFEDEDVGAIVLTGGERLFSAGADIREFGTSLATAAPTLRELILIIEDGPKHVVAAIAGACMGGGLELALGCHARVAKPDAVVALPEVKLGLLPGAGGTQRLPRAIGLERALAMIVSGETRTADELATTGLFDEVVTGNLETAAVAFAGNLVTGSRAPRRLRDIDIAKPDAEAVVRKARETALASPKRLPAPLKCIDAVEAAATGFFEAGLKLERELFDSLLASPESRALRHVFGAERSAAKIPGLPTATPPRTIEHVGIVGAGTMGRGIATTFLNAGFPVRILDVSDEAIEHAVAAIRQSYESSVSKGRITAAERDKRMALLGTASRFDELAACDLIIEAVFEDIDLKRRIFGRLDSSAKPDAILASNTSTLDLDEIASSTSRPGDVIGLHFFSPAHVMRLLEVVRGDETSDDVLATCVRLARRIGKVAVVAGVCDGFIGNRMYHRYQAAAEELLLKGASPQQVDTALEGFGMAMGPFRAGDLAGLDIGWAIRKHRARQNPSEAVPRIPDRLCEAGRFGQKTRAGLYRYEPGDRTAIPDPFVDRAISAFRAERGIEPAAVSDEEIVAQCIGALVTEGERILDEGIALRASDIDVVWVNGYGFPAHRGGPMYHASEVGLAPSKGLPK